jgi:hypothetical protein
VPGFHGLSVDAPEGERWELALTLLESGEAPVWLGAVTVRRDAQGPTPDGLVHVEFPCNVDPDRATKGAAEADMAQALALVGVISAADPRFEALLQRFWVVYEYIYDYGMGSILLATARADGTVDWQGQ